MAKLSERFGKCQAYIAAQVKRGEREGKLPAQPDPAVTISRQTGAGAIALGDELVDYLNAQSKTAECQWTVFDKNLVEKVLEDHDLPRRLEQFMPEDKPRHVEDAIGDMLGIHPPNWELVKHTQETIYRLAKMGRCVLVGRGANIITEDLPHVLRLRLIGSLEKRVVRCMDQYGITEAKARDLIKKQDRARRRYLLAYYDREIDDALDYHLVVNVDAFSSLKLVRLIGDMISNWNK